MHLAELFSLVLCQVAVGLAGAAIARREARERGYAIGALVVTAVMIAVACFIAWERTLTDVIAFSGEGVSPIFKRDELTKAFAAADPVANVAFVCGLVAGAVALVGVAHEWRKYRWLARAMTVVVVAIVATFLVRADALGHRQEHIGHALLVEALAEPKISPAADWGCGNLEAALEMAYGIGEVEGIVPDVRARAKSCIDKRLHEMDDEASEHELLFRRNMNPREVGDATKTELFVLRSPLLLDPTQRTEAERRVVLERAQARSAGL